jgi:hypothetical protein
MPAPADHDPVLAYVTEQAYRQRSLTETARCYDLLATRLSPPARTRITPAEIQRTAQALTVLNLFQADVAEEIAGVAAHTGLTPELASRCAAADHAARAAALLTGALAAAAAPLRGQTAAERAKTHRTVLDHAAAELRTAGLVLVYGTGVRTTARSTAIPPTTAAASSPAPRR